MLVVRLPIAAPAPTRYSLIPRLAGFPSKGLASLFRFTESTLTVGLLDDVSGGRFATAGSAAADGTNNVEAARSSADNMGGAAGGLKLAGMRSLATAPIDITQPFSILIAATMPLPSDLVPVGVVSVGNVPTSGFMAFYQITVAASLGSTFPLYMKPSINGAFDATVANTPVPLVAAFNSLCFFVVKHKGGGVMVFEEHRGATVSSVQITYDLSGLQGPTGSKSASQAVKIGGVYPGIIGKAGVIYDALAVYSKVTSADEDQAFFDAAASLALTRNRS